MSVEIRSEVAAQRPALLALHRAAFDSGEEPAIVRALWERGEVTAAFVACEGEAPLGHVLASPITLESGPRLRLWGIAPLAVAPAHQRRGIGSRLMQHVIEHAQASDVDALFLLGDPQYYSRFGFARSHCENEYGATDAFMQRELRPGCLQGLAGVARYVEPLRP